MVLLVTAIRALLTCLYKFYVVDEPQRVQSLSETLFGAPYMKADRITVL